MFFYNQDYTLTDIERLLVGFRDGDPDGNGRNDTIPMGAFNNFLWSWGGLLGAFGNNGRNGDLNGQVLEYNVLPSYKDFLKHVARWYQMELIDKEFPVLDRTRSYEKIKAGVIGYVDLGINAVGEDWAMERPPNSMASDEEVARGVSVVTIPPPIGPNGQRGGWIYDPFPLSQGRRGAQLVVNKSVSDEKLAKVLEIIDYLRFGDTEQFIWDWSGLPGVHSDWTGEPGQSRASLRPLDEVPAGYPKIGRFPNEYPNFIPKDRLAFYQNPTLSAFFNNWYYTDAGRQLSLMPYRWDLLGETALGDMQSKYGATLNTIRDEFTLKAITGQINIDAEWDAYVASWMSNGGTELLAELAKAPLAEPLLSGRLEY